MTFVYLINFIKMTKKFAIAKLNNIAFRNLGFPFDRLNYLSEKCKNMCKIFFPKTS